MELQHARLPAAMSGGRSERAAPGVPVPDLATDRGGNEPRSPRGTGNRISVRLAGARPAFRRASCSRSIRVLAPAQCPHEKFKRAGQDLVHVSTRIDMPEEIPRFVQVPPGHGIRLKDQLVTNGAPNWSMAFA